MVDRTQQRREWIAKVSSVFAHLNNHALKSVPFNAARKFASSHVVSMFQLALVIEQKCMQNVDIFGVQRYAANAHRHACLNMGVEPVQRVQQLIVLETNVSIHLVHRRLPQNIPEILPFLNFLVREFSVLNRDARVLELVLHIKR